MSLFASQIRSYRKKAGLSEKNLAIQAGLGNNRVVRRLERGESVFVTSLIKAVHFFGHRLNVYPHQIKGLREKRGYSQEYLSEISGVSHSRISYVENTGSMTLERYMVLCEILGEPLRIIEKDEGEQG